MKRFVIVLGVLVALAAAPSALGKACIRIQAPPVVAPGTAVRVSVRTYLPHWVSGRVARLEPVSLGRDTRITLQAEGPRGEWVRLATRPVGNGELRVGRISFPTRGVWRLTAIEWEGAPRSCAPPFLVRVR